MIVLLSVLVVLSERQPTATEAALSVTGTSLVLFFAHVYAGGLAERIRRGALPSLQSLRRLASGSWPVVAVITWPLVLLALSALGVMTTSTAIAISVWLAVAGLGLAGWRAAQIGHASLVGKLLSTAVNFAVGMGIVGLKVAFH